MNKWWKATREEVKPFQARTTKHTVVYVDPYTGANITAYKKTKWMGWFESEEEARKFRMDLLIAEENELYFKIAELQQDILDIEALKNE